MIKPLPRPYGQSLDTYRQRMARRANRDIIIASILISVGGVMGLLFALG